MSVYVTDHALVRYLERVHGIDMDFFRQCAATECEDVYAPGVSAARIGDHWFVFDHGRLITVLAKDQRPTNRRELRQWEKAQQEIEREQAIEAAE